MPISKFYLNISRDPPPFPLFFCGMAPLKNHFFPCLPQIPPAPTTSWKMYGPLEHNSIEGGTEAMNLFW